MDTVLFVFGALVGMLAATAIISARLGRGSSPLVFLLVFSTFAGYFNNLFNRHPAVHVARFVILTVVGGLWLLFRRRSVPLPSTPLDRPIGMFLAFYTLQAF